MFEKAFGNEPNKLHANGILDGRFVPKDTIRLRAYQKWEAAGKPAGDGVEFWLAAERELSRSMSRIRRWWTHVQPWIVPARLKFVPSRRPHGSVRNP